jgi:hypothetical protein
MGEEPLRHGSGLEAALELPEGVSSIGALGHSTNTCKPCAWNWKPDGCINGMTCNFCHLCERGEFRRRRKDRDALLRASGKDRKGRMAKSVAFEGR